ncbi:MAG: thioredoxin family protein [Trueperaceae bacterium]
MAIKFASSASAAFDQAKKEGKSVMIDFNADWCAPCQVMKKEAFTDASVAALLEDVVPVGINVDRPGADSEWLEREGQLALPTVVFYRADGTEIGRTVGYGGVESFKAEIEAILSKE